MEKTAQKIWTIRAFSRLFIIFGCIFSIGCANLNTPAPLIDGAPEPNVYEVIPFQLDEAGRILVDVMVNDTGPHKFMIDTAATKTLLLEPVRQSLGIKFIDDEVTFVHGAVLRRQRPVMPLRSIKIGTLELNDIKSFSLPELISINGADKIGGILGLDFLSSYAVYFNVVDRRVVFAKSGYKPPRSKYVSVPIKFDALGFLEQGLPFVPASIDRRRVNALLDFGASVTIVNWAAAQSAFKINVRNHVAGRFDFQGAFGDIPLRSRAVGVDVAIGKRLWGNQSLEISNLGIFKTMKREELPTLIVSAKLLRDDNFIIDFPARRLYLEADGSKRLRRNKGKDGVWEFGVKSGAFSEL